MELAILQQSALDDADYNQFHQSLASALMDRHHEVEIFQSRTEGWRELEYLGPLCRAFSLQKYWSDITKHSLVYGSPLNILPFLDAPITPIISIHSVTESLKRSLRYPDYGEETATLKRHLEEAKTAGLSLDYNHEEQYRFQQEAEEAICQSNYSLAVSSRSIKEDLIRYYDVKPNRITILPYGVEPLWFNPSQQCRECDAIFREVNPKEPLLIYYANLKRGVNDFLAQGVDRILETFQRIRELQRLVILFTDDPAYKTLFARHGALVVENPTPEHISHIFRHGGMYVQTARYEPRNLPLIQAMASGLPIISFPVGLAEDVVETGKDGFQVQNLIQLIAKVDFLRGNSDKAQEFGHNAQKLAKSKFTIARSAEQYEKYLLDLNR